MNATELAFLLDKSREESYTSEHLVAKAATMLRQQQAEIDNLTSIKYVNGVTISKLYAEIEALKAPKIPLLEQEIKFILGNGQCWTGEDCSMPNLMYIIRAVEAAHGIGV